MKPHALDLEHVLHLILVTVIQDLEEVVANIQSVLVSTLQMLEPALHTVLALLLELAFVLKDGVAMIVVFLFVME
ncbi:hypothetical protein D3C80_2085220 [compost metagenome]